ATDNHEIVVPVLVGLIPSLRGKDKLNGVNPLFKTSRQKELGRESRCLFAGLEGDTVTALNAVSAWTDRPDDAIKAGLNAPELKQVVKLSAQVVSYLDRVSDSDLSLIRGIYPSLDSLGGDPLEILHYCLTVAFRDSLCTPCGTDPVSGDPIYRRVGDNSIVRLSPDSVLHCQTPCPFIALGFTRSQGKVYAECSCYKVDMGLYRQIQGE
ncbi:hypothetical protein KIPB_008547, partial [Kipferlia bialata]